MQHAIELTELGPQGPAMAEAVSKCVHCGFCLSACPTYKVLGEEMDSPRGRIYLMKNALENELAIDDTMPYIDRCLGCMACVTACPSGVEYGELLAPFRAHSEEKRSRPILDRAARLVINQTLPYPKVFRSAALAGKLAKPLARVMPRQFSAMLELLPDEAPPIAPLPAVVPAVGTRRARVALLAGCVQQVLAPSINQATIEVLTRNGVEVVIPEAQGCCGSLAMHTGEARMARSLARRNFKAFPTDVDAIITNAAGCGSGIHEYGLLFAGRAEEEEAKAFAAKARDISVFLDELGLLPPPPLPEPLIVAYHDACHLAHAQRVTQPPRRLLASIPNLTIREIYESDLCCGSAGTYNLEQPEIAKQLGKRKARNIVASGAQMVVMGNIGCMTQIRTHLAQLGQPLPVLHTIELLAKAYAAGENAG
jgi:glycolate oxidase iron-sulfur subunit